MKVFEFEKSAITRFKEYKDILQCNESIIPASKISNQWSYFLELQIEPNGWHAIWKIPRVICEEMKFRYPTVVFGIVKQVLFSELKASFIVLAVEDDDIHMPELQIVFLEDLCIVKEQENSALNIEKTAECVDQLRFFYKNIWMPWDYDNDDDLDWVEKHLESRIQFNYDLKSGNIKKSVAARIKRLLTEARYIKTKCDYLQLNLSEDKLDEIDNNDSVVFIQDLMKLHIRMSMIKSEIEMLENLDMRKVYEAMQSNERINHTESPIIHPSKTTENNHELEITTGVHIVTILNTIPEQINLLKIVQEIIGDNNTILISNSLQQALEDSKSNYIILSSGEHHINYIDEFCNGSIIGVSKNDHEKSEKVIIKSKNDDIVLLIINGNCTLKNLLLDCRNVRQGIVIQNGIVTLKNCEIVGNNRSTGKGIIISGVSKLILDDCVIKNFACGLSVNNSSEVHILCSKIYNCEIGLELEDNTQIKFKENASIEHSKKCGIWFNTDILSNKPNIKKIIVQNQEELNDMNLYELLPWTGNCLFEQNGKGNIVIWNRSASFLSPLLNNELTKFVGSMKDISTSCGSSSGSDSEECYIIEDESLDKTTITIDDSVTKVK